MPELNTSGFCGNACPVPNKLAALLCEDGFQKRLRGLGARGAAALLVRNVAKTGACPLGRPRVVSIEDGSAVLECQNGKEPEISAIGDALIEGEGDPAAVICLTFAYREVDVTSLTGPLAQEAAEMVVSTYSLP